MFFYVLLNECFVSYSGVVLEKVCEYLYYNQKNSDAKDVPDMEIPPELCLELLMAADYLDGNITMLLNLSKRLTEFPSMRIFHNLSEH